MGKLRLLGVLCVCVIALVSVLTSSNDPLVSNFLNMVFIISCGVIGTCLLRKTNLCESLKVVRQKISRRFDLPVEFPLTDGQGVTVIQNRRRLPDRRKFRNNFDDQSGMPPKMVRV